MCDGKAAYGSGQKYSGSWYRAWTAWVGVKDAGSPAGFGNRAQRAGRHSRS